MSKICPECGEELLDNAKFCKNCGAQIDSGAAEANVQQTQTYAPPVEEKNYTLAIVLGYICAILIPIIGVIIAIYLLTRKDSEKASLHGKIMLVVAIIVWAFSAFILMGSY